ncbi:ATP-binding cassette domain-containing protein [Corynebacterium kroppenstedtii]|uniref:ATP-binding cassette domain-containing protein n=1 Tax=Corynebacterium kroppenstedtii TaxID=161879 RepID=UPI00264B4FF4|nr:ATP-binding cassette domain-containing protein [Corynebacterium kroppenstedtii]MDN8624237.1 ATP-binding cassette domain-containing protein [Corynebacterium kroppenstedtii]
MSPSRSLRSRSATPKATPQTDSAPSTHPHTNDLALDVRDLRCHLGSGKNKKEILKGITLSIPRGKVLAVLGANGAGKTTLINALSTLIPISGGSATINGHDVTSDPAGVRSSISLTGQYAAVDNMLTGHENLTFFGTLAGLSTREAKDRATELLRRFGLERAANSRVADYSGGMRRRLDIASSLTVQPPLLFLDEPTTGLDPASRNDVWDMVHHLQADGTSILLTTQYLDEADHLADRIVVLGGGRVLDEGTSAELKSRYGSSAVTVTFRDTPLAERFATIATDHGFTAAQENTIVRLDAPDGHRSLVRALSLWDGSEDDITDAALIPPTLEDVYMAVADSGDVARTDAREDTPDPMDRPTPTETPSDAHTPEGGPQ